MKIICMPFLLFLFLLIYESFFYFILVSVHPTQKVCRAASQVFLSCLLPRQPDFPRRRSLMS